jgi:hypothetical protein
MRKSSNPSRPTHAAQLPDPGNTVRAADEGSYLPPYCQPAQKGQVPPKAEQHARTRELAGPWVAGVARLQSMPPLAGFSFHRWGRVCLDCAELVERWGAEMQQLGWSVEDAFGIHPKVPGTAVQCYGLGVLLNGGKLVELTAAGATIERPNGVRHKFIRPPVQSAVPIWTAGDKR